MNIEKFTAKKSMPMKHFPMIKSKFQLIFFSKVIKKIVGFFLDVVNYCTNWIQRSNISHSKNSREKFLRTTKFENNDELQTFISQLYVFLLDEMHRSLNKSVHIEEPEAIPPLRNTDAQLRTFALEAECNGDYLLAANYYKQVEIFKFYFIFSIKFL